jgi:hypothetical protein
MLPVQILATETDAAQTALAEMLLPPEDDKEKFELPFRRFDLLDLHVGPE